MARRGLRCVGTAIDRLDAYALHQRRNVAAADGETLAAQDVAQHPAARERAVQMQFVDAPHDSEVRGRYGPGPVVDATPADVQNLRLTSDGKIVVAVDHRFALNMPALMSAPSKKSFSSANSPILA